MTTHRTSAQAACNAPPPTAPATASTDSAREMPGNAMRVRLQAAGRRGAPSALAGEALADYWRFVGHSTLEERTDLVRGLRADIAAGRAGPRACLPVALGEPQLDLAREATRLYLGAGPTSAERREHAVADVLDWIARSLALNRAALCCALLDTASAVSLERLSTLRSRFSPHDAAAVFASFDGATVGEVAAFIEEWRALAA